MLNLKKSKTEFMLLGTQQKLSKCDTEINLTYRGQSIYTTDRYKYLGNVVDPKLTMSDNFESKYKKA